MTVASEVNRSGPYTGNGVTTVFAYAFRIIDAGHIKVIRAAGGIETVLVLNTDYTVSGVGDAGGGSITTTVAPTAAQTITIIRKAPFTQETDLVNQGPFFAETIEAALDLSIMRDQQLAEIASRAVLVPASNAGYDPNQLVNDVMNVKNDRTAADASRAAAEAAASSLGNQVHQYDTRALAIAATVPVSVAYIRTMEFSAGNGGGALFKRGVAIAATGADFQSADGAYWNLADSQFNVRQFGAKGDGATDDAAAIQAAINAAQVSAAKVYFPRGTYRINSTLTLGNAVSLVGEGRYAVTIESATATLTSISVNTDNQVHISGINFRNAVTATGGGAIVVVGGATHNLFSTFRDLEFSACYSCITFQKAGSWTIDNCYFSSFVAFGVIVRNTYNVDAGDSQIVSSTFTAAAGATSIHQESSGGLKVIGNKIISGQYGYRMVLAVGAVTSILVLAGNSIENQSSSGIQMLRAGASGTFNNVVISGNQVAGQPTAIDLPDATAGWLSRLAIVGNQMSIATAGGTGVSITAASDFVIDGNQFAGQGGTSVGISIGASAGTGRIGSNSYNNLTTPISNGSTSVLVTQRTQKGSSSATTSTAGGSLFYGTVNVVFPVAFATPPKVACIVTLNGISAWGAGATTTDFTATVWAPTNGTNVSFDWIAFSDA